MLQFTRNIGRLASSSKSAVFVSQKGSFRTFATDTNLQTSDKVSIDKSSGKIRVDFKNSFKLHKLEKGPENYGYTNKEELLSYYRQMQVIRRLETMADNLYKQKLIRGFLHLYNGQEAVVVGAEAATRREDHVITAYRNHAHYLGRGGTTYEALCELMGKADGCASGKGGSMHFYRKQGNYHGGNGIVGAQGPVGTGVAFSLKYNGTDNVCLTYYGDGAANQGQLFEAYNMAMLWKLPVIFICENNKYAMGTSVERAAAVPTFYTRGDFVPGMWIDGMNVIAVREGVKFAADHCRAGKGPIILEIETYRYVGHSMSDPGSYRTKDEVNTVKAQRDPIDKVKLFLTSTGQSTEEELKEIEKQVKKQIEEDTERAKAAPVPEYKALYEDVYIDKPYFVRAVEKDASVIVQ